jgi:membrane-associated phospholipid phosphatase
MNNGRKKISMQFSWKSVVIACLFLAALFLFALIANEVVNEKEEVIDKIVSSYFLQHSNVGLINAMRYVSFFGSAYFLFPSYVVLAVYFILKKRTHLAVAISTVGLSSYFLEQAMKHFFHRKRPSLPVIKSLTTYSFPSGHTFSSFIFCSILGYLIWHSALPVNTKRLIMVLLLLVPFIIGLSRIVLNVHYVSDVVAGFCLGVVWIITCSWILIKLNIAQ